MVIAPPSAVATSRLVLRDGSTAGVRPSVLADRDAIRRFFHELSPASRRLRFLASVQAPDDLINRLSDNSDPRKALTLVVTRLGTAGPEIVGVGSYFATSTTSAEVAFAVDDDFHGKGIATALLERLASFAASEGFEHFSASVLAENIEMLDVFRDSGFAVRSFSENGCVEERLSLQPSAAAVAAADARDRHATIASLRAILEPRAVAVIGASRSEANLGRRVFESLLRSGFTGPVYPVNRSVDELCGRACYRAARDLPAGVDLAVIAVPREAVLDAVDDCAVAGVKGIVVISAGFAETDERGRQLQAHLVERIRGYGMRMLGPNCMGLTNAAPGVRLNASFADHLPPAGRIALASQSGGLGLAVLSLAAARQMGLSTFFSLGNKADISGNDLLQYAESDPATSVVMLYLESFGNPRRFGQIARRVSRTKPIIVVKAGRTPAGNRAAASHTAGLAASELTVEGLFQQAGVIRADTINDMFDIAACLDAQPLPHGGRVAIVTNAGGPGILAADACSAAGLEVVPTAIGKANPLDLIASAGADAYHDTIAALLASDDVDAVIAIYTTIDSRRTEGILSAIQEGVVSGRATGGANKPVLVCTMASSDRAPLIAAGETIPVYEFPEQAACALGKAAAYAAWRAVPAGAYPLFQTTRMSDARELCRDIAGARGDTWLTTPELRSLLQATDLRAAPAVLSHSADEAAALARVFGFPVVAKIASTSALHKTELGGVRLHLTNEKAVRAAYDELSAIAAEKLDGTLDGILIQPMVTGGVEAIVGLSQDPMFGPLVAFGLGGINVELFRDVGFRIAPLTDRDADELMRSVRGFALLSGYRNQPPADIVALRDILLKISYLGAQIPELLELEFNPVIALSAGHGCQIVDARARVGRSARKS
ncbi:MAG TPA: GNAT family N-acetyltransferase [Vicinamibacterales bacterium]|nr:GNAT family N-acetyltransferase [Vicinamibacterales bacterium]